MNSANTPGSRAAARWPGNRAAWPFVICRMMVPLPVFAAVVLVVWAGCGGDEPGELFAAGERAAAEQATRGQARAQFEELLARFPEHELAPRALKQLAMLAQQDGQMDTAIQRYERLLQDYPASDQADEAQFMVAFICEEYLKDLDRAREAYQRVIDRYPSSELAVSARQLLPNVGRDPEEWVEFQEVDAEAGEP